MTLVKHKATVTNCAYSADNKFIISGSTDSLIFVWNAHTCEEISSFTCYGRVTALAVSTAFRDSGAFAVGDGSGELYLMLAQLSV